MIKWDVELGSIRTSNDALAWRSVRFFPDESGEKFRVFLCSDLIFHPSPLMRNVYTRLE